MPVGGFSNLFVFLTAGTILQKEALRKKNLFYTMQNSSRWETSGVTHSRLTHLQTRYPYGVLRNQLVLPLLIADVEIKAQEEEVIGQS